MSEKLIGAWELVEAVQYRDGVKSHHHGTNPVGQIVYSANGRVAATIMDPIWLENKTRLLKGAGEFMAYAGPFEVVGNLVRHHVKICSWNDVVGTTLERTFELRGDNEVFLRTVPVTSKSGATYIGELLWRRF